MSDGNEISLVRSSNGELVELGTTNIENIDNKISEVQVNLELLNDHTAVAVGELLQLSIAAQNPAYYEALAKLITASAKASQVGLQAIQLKMDLYNGTKGANTPITDPEDNKGTTVVNNHLHLTTAEAVRAIMENKKADKEE